MPSFLSRLRIDRLAGWLLNRPRLIRILIAGLFAIAIVLLLDRLFAPSYYTDSRLFTFALSVVAGVLWYGVGWAALIGFSGDADQPPHTARLDLYTLISVVVLVITIILTVADAISGSLEV